jgi:hypothetical protein
MKIKRRQDHRKEVFIGPAVIMPGGRQHWSMSPGWSPNELRSLLR